MRNLDAVKLGDKIVKLRELQGLNQKELAKAADMYQQNLSEIEQGYVYPRKNTLKKIAAALKVTAEDLLGRTSNTPDDGLPSNIMQKHVAILESRIDEIEQNTQLLKQLVNQSGLTTEEVDLIKALRKLGDASLVKSLLAIIKLDPSSFVALLTSGGSGELPTKPKSGLPSSEGFRGFEPKKKPVSS